VVTALALWRPLPPAARIPQASDPALDVLRTRDGEQNPLVFGDAVAGSASFWRSSHERAGLERRAASGDAAAAYELWAYYAFTTDDRASARRWLEQAARGGHEAAQLNLAVQIGKSNCQDAKRRLQMLADKTSDVDLRESALDWLADPYFCVAEGAAN
jgi:TPR repeat protein